MKEYRKVYSTENKRADNIRLMKSNRKKYLKVIRIEQ